MATMTIGQLGHSRSPPPFPQHIQHIMNMGPSHRSSPMPQPSPIPSRQTPSSTSTFYQAGATIPKPFGLPARNEVDLTRERLISLLEFFSQVVVSQFNRPIRLVVHGGACMLLHPMSYQASLEQKEYLPNLPHRRSTRDVDYIHRSFVTEMALQGVHNAGEKLKQCIQMTASAFRLGLDWMNSDADIALPMATYPNGVTYDPIYQASIGLNNVNLHTVFRSTNGMLTLISVNPFWAVALKLVRYSQQDASDICLLLRNGTKISRTQWSPDTLRQWLFDSCWAMGYIAYDVPRQRLLNSRIEHALKMLSEWEKNEAECPNPELKRLEAKAFSSVNVAPTPRGDFTQLAAMGGLERDEDEDGIGMGRQEHVPVWDPWASKEAMNGTPPSSTQDVATVWSSTSPRNGRRSISHGNSPDSSPTSGGLPQLGLGNSTHWNSAAGGRTDAECCPAEGFVPAGGYDDLYDYSVGRPGDLDAAGRKARKKRKKLEKNRSASLPASGFAMPVLFVPPPLPGGMPPPPRHTASPHLAHLSRAASPWQLHDPQPGELTDREVTGLASLRDLNNALLFDQRDATPSLGQMLQAPYNQMQSHVAMPAPLQDPSVTAGGSWRRPEKVKKSKDSKKKKIEKEREKERKRNRLDKWTPWSLSSRPDTLVDKCDSGSDDDSNDSSDGYQDAMDASRRPPEASLPAPWVGGNADPNEAPTSFYYPLQNNVPGSSASATSIYPSHLYSSQPASQRESPTQHTPDDLPRSKPPSLQTRTPNRSQASSPPPTHLHPSTYPGMINSPRLTMPIPPIQGRPTPHQPPTYYAPNSVPALAQQSTHQRPATVQPLPLSNITGKSRHNSTEEEPPFIPPPEVDSRAAPGDNSVLPSMGGALGGRGNPQATYSFATQRTQALVPQSQLVHYPQQYQYQQQQQASAPLYGRPYH